MTARAAELARDEGMAATTHAADPRTVLDIDRVIAMHNASGLRWSANDIRDMFPVVSPPLIGARINAAANREPVEMRRVDMTRSTLKSTHRAWIAVWQGVSS